MDDHLSSLSRLSRYIFTRLSSCHWILNAWSALGSMIVNPIILKREAQLTITLSPFSDWPIVSIFQIDIKFHWPWSCEPTIPMSAATQYSCLSLYLPGVPPRDNLLTSRRWRTFNMPWQGPRIKLYLCPNLPKKIFSITHMRTIIDLEIGNVLFEKRKKSHRYKCN